MQVPILSKELNAIKEKNACLHFEVGQLENPKYLFKMLHNKDYSHLKYPLENGLEVILYPKPGIPVVSLNLWYRVGSANETRGKRSI